MSYEYDPQKIVYFASTDSRGSKVPFGIRANDRMRHMYVIGKTGMGKSTMLENLAIQDIQNGEGICFIDPHGSTAEKLLEFVPESRIKDVVYFAPFDIEYPLGFNVMEDVGYDKRHLVVAGLMSSFKRIWVDAWSARMEYFLQNTLLALLEYPETTLIDVNRMLINKEFRNKVVEYITDPIVRRFWVEEFAGYSDKYTQEATPAIQNKIGQFASNPLVRNIIAQPKSTFDIREMMDTNKIFIINLSKGRMGEQNADLLGSMLVTKIYLAAMSRAEESPEALGKLPPFYLYVDEFQSVVNESFSNILSEARKYKLSLTIAHQYIEQVDEEIRAAVFGNVGTTIAFRVGPFDAETLKTIYEPTFYAEDLVNLGFAQIYLTLMIDGIGSKPFSALTLPPVDNPPSSFVKEIIESSRIQFSRSRKEVEKLISSVDEALPKGGFDKKAKYKPQNKNSKDNLSSTNVKARPLQDNPINSKVVTQNADIKIKSMSEFSDKKVYSENIIQDTNKEDKKIVKKPRKEKTEKIREDKETNAKNALKDALLSITPVEDSKKKKSEVLSKELKDLGIKVNNIQASNKPQSSTNEELQVSGDVMSAKKEKGKKGKGSRKEKDDTPTSQIQTKEVPRETLVTLLQSNTDAT